MYKLSMYVSFMNSMVVVFCLLVLFVLFVFCLFWFFVSWGLDSYVVFSMENEPLEITLSFLFCFGDKTYHLMLS